MIMKKLIEAMKNCEQMPGLSVLEHGEMVVNYYNDLLNHIRNKDELKYDWKLPEWIYDKIILDNLDDDELMNRYQLYHDCGKPFCIEYDDEGKKHFPNHAQVSYEKWLEFNPEDKKVAKYILMDMDIHLLKADGANEFSKRDEAKGLLLTGLAELHANASMFGGIESTSFKIKWKSLNKSGKRLINIWKGEA